jgi:hypothetical protein
LQQIDEQQNKLMVLQHKIVQERADEDRNAAKLAALSSQYNAAADAQQKVLGI